MQIKNSIQIGIFATMTVVLGSLLFIGGPQDDSGRVIKEFWNSGHAILFAILTFALLSYTPLKNSSLTKK
ncbi:MAG: hypothetical protein OQJ89_03160, partial [Kangiellaceae bacterium]|nr:hypothetical protein [Kangiellaceae bacterium]